jgi:hypothetical protein
MKRRLTAAAIIAAVSTVVVPGLAAAEPVVSVDGYSFRVLDEERVYNPDNITGIDYRNGAYTLISDDSSRVYSADLALTDTGFGAGTFNAPTQLLEADGTGFPQGGEAVRVAADGSLLWANEGRRAGSYLLNSTAQRNAAGGTFVAQHPATPHGAASTDQKGIRDRGGIAGLTLNPTGTLAISATAAPLLQDGASTVRFSFADSNTGAVLSQLAYELDPAPARGTNKVAEILTVTASRYLVLERAQDKYGRNSVRLYEATTVGARSVLQSESLAGATYTPMQKRLLVDFADLDVTRVSNFAGMTWGPALPSGERTLVLVSDNDCDGRTHFAALAVTVS